MHTQTTTGKTAEHYAILAERIENEFTWNRRRGRPRTLSLTGALQITLLSYRQNVTEQLIADLVGINQSTVSRTIALVEAMLNVVVDDEQPDVEAALGGTTAVVDGTLRAEGRLVEGQVVTNWKKALEQLSIAFPERIHRYL